MHPRRAASECRMCCRRDSGKSASPTSGNVAVVDSLPAGLTATAIVGVGWIRALPTLACTRNDALGQGLSSEYPQITVTVNVAPDAAPTVINTATVSGGGDVYGGDN